MTLKEHWQRFRALPKWEQAFLACFVALIAHYGSTKGTGTVAYPRTNADVQYFTDKGSYVTNDYVHIDFDTVVVPASANFFGACRELSKSNDTDWVEFYTNTVGGVNPPADIPFANATNFNFLFYTDWTPAPSVHTNGVLYVNWGVEQPPLIIETPSDSSKALHAIPLNTEMEMTSDVWIQSVELTDGIRSRPYLIGNPQSFWKYGFNTQKRCDQRSVFNKLLIDIEWTGEDDTFYYAYGFQSSVSADAATSETPLLKLYQTNGVVYAEFFRYLSATYTYQIPKGRVTLGFYEKGKDIRLYVNGEEKMVPFDVSTQIMYQDNYLTLCGLVSKTLPVPTGSVKFYGCKLFLDDVLVHEYIPAVNVNTGRAEIFDPFEEREYVYTWLWWNSVSAEFSVPDDVVMGGNEIVAPKPLEGFSSDNNLLETLELNEGEEE